MTSPGGGGEREAHLEGLGRGVGAGRGGAEPGGDRDIGRGVEHHHRLDGLDPARVCDQGGGRLDHRFHRPAGLQGHHRLLGGHVLERLDVHHRHHARERGAEHAVVETFAGGGEGGGRHVAPGPLLLVAHSRDHPVGHQAFRTLELGLGGVVVGPGRRQVGLELTPIEARDLGPLGDALPLAHREVRHLPGLRKAEIGRGGGFDDRGQAHRPHVLLGLEHEELGRPDRRFGRRLGLVGTPGRGEGKEGRGRPGRPAPPPSPKGTEISRRSDCARHVSSTLPMVCGAFPVREGPAPG